MDPLISEEYCFSAYPLREGGCLKLASSSGFLSHEHEAQHADSTTQQDPNWSIRQYPLYHILGFVLYYKVMMAFVI